MLHPGYGFLAENVVFVEMCRGHGINFIGPNPDNIRVMRDKATARDTMKNAAVPCVRGEQRGRHHDLHPTALLLPSFSLCLSLAKKSASPLLICRPGFLHCQASLRHGQPGQRLKELLIRRIDIQFQ